ncbi:MAG: S8 family serine peptidase [Roseovarius sp.]
MAQQAPDGPTIVMADETGTSAIASTGALMAKARELGEVRVIVGVETGFQADGSLSAAEEVAERAAIDAGQAQIMNVVQRPEAVRQFESIPYMAMTLSPADLSRLMAAPGVTSIEEDVPVPPTLSESVPLVDAPKLWRRGHNGNGVAVAILDTGVRPKHVAFRSPAGPKILRSACFSTNSAISSSVCPNGNDKQISPNSGFAGRNCSNSISGCDHGTHVAAIAGGFQRGNHGMAKRADIIPIQVFSRFDSTDYCGSSAPCVLSYTSDQIAGLEKVLQWRRNGVKIASANMSLGSGQYSDFCDDARSSLKSIIDKLLRNGVATVIASGNDGYDGSVGAPACISSAITVGSTTKTDGMSFFSNHDEMVDILAPGSSIVAADASSRRGLTTKSGTSMATPHVAGAFALLLDAKMNATPHQIERALECTGVPVTRDSLPKPRISMLEAYRALKNPDQKKVFTFRNWQQVRQWDDFSGRWIHRVNKMRVSATEASTWYVSQSPFCANDIVVAAKLKRQDPDTSFYWNSGILISSQGDENGQFSGLMFAYYVTPDNETRAFIWELDGIDAASGAGDATMLCDSGLFNGPALGQIRFLKIRKRTNKLIFEMDGGEVCRATTNDRFENGHVSALMAAPENDRAHKLDVQYVRMQALKQSTNSFAEVTGTPAGVAMSGATSITGSAGGEQQALLSGAAAQ